jgi:hypothetical protein
MHLSSEYKSPFNRLDVRKKISDSIERRENISKTMTGRKLSEKTKAKISRANTIKWSSPEIRAKISGGNHYMRKRPETVRRGPASPHWKGGISYEPYCPLWTNELRERIRAFFDYECIFCGKTQEENGCLLSCHHVEYDKQACCDGEPVQFAALCRRCHSKTNYNRPRWENMLHVIIHEIYNDRSYYTKEEWKKVMLPLPH